MILSWPLSVSRCTQPGLKEVEEALAGLSAAPCSLRLLRSSAMCSRGCCQSRPALSSPGLSHLLPLACWAADELSRPTGERVRDLRRLSAAPLDLSGPLWPAESWAAALLGLRDRCLCLPSCPTVLPAPGPALLLWGNRTDVDKVLLCCSLRGGPELGPASLRADLLQPLASPAEGWSLLSARMPFNRPAGSV